MDWAIRAARKKTQRKPGSTRSIIETLDDLNNITTDAHIGINHRLHESNEWLKKSVYMSKVKPEEKKMEECLMSPENTHNRMNVQFEVEQDYDLSVSRNNSSKDVTNTPRNILHNDKSITPKSLRRKEITDEMNKFSIHDTHKSPIEPLNIVKTSVDEDDKSSPWSPYKVEKILRESSKASESPLNLKKVR